MPQFDTFIFSSSLFYFIISFFVLLWFNFNRFLPHLSAILKLRYKLATKSTSKSDIILSYQDAFSTFARYLAFNEKI